MLDATVPGQEEGQSTPPPPLPEAGNILPFLDLTNHQINVSGGQLDPQAPVTNADLPQHLASIDTALQTPINNSSTQDPTILPSPVKESKKPMSHKRVPFVGEIDPYPSPFDADTVFGLRRVSNRDVMAARDKNSVVRYISEEGSERFVQERDYPAGTMRLDTIMLSLANWNITDDQDKAIPVSRDNVLDYLEPDELEALYDKILELNPILTGQQATKNAS